MEKKTRWNIELLVNILHEWWNAKTNTGFDTSREAWLNIETSRSRAKIIRLKGELQNLKKGNLTMNEYIFKIKVLIKKLQYDGCSVIEEERFVHVLGGFDESFDNVLITDWEIIRWRGYNWLCQIFINKSLE